MFIDILGYISAVFVLLVQPVRVAWGAYLLVRPPAGRYLNRTVLLVSLFIKLLSLFIAGYFLLHFGLSAESMFDAGRMRLLIPSFMLYAMSELVARFIYHAADEQI